MRVIDNFLSTYSEFKRYTNQAEFELKTVGDRSFFVTPVPKHLQAIVYDKIKRIFSFKDEFIPTICFFRKNTPDIDTDIRIHTDQNHCEFASVLYMSENRNSLNGTAFWDHPTYGNALPTDAKPKVIENINEYEGKDESIWTLNTVVGARENRCATYPSNLFHSRYPFKADHQRLIGVFFWSTSFLNPVSISRYQKTHMP